MVYEFKNESETAQETSTEQTETQEPQDEAQLKSEPYVSPTLKTLRDLKLLDPSKSWNPSTVCEGCREAIWLLSDTNLKAYCRAMHVIVWSQQEQTKLTSCDAQRT
jgi:hypothetical protein